MSDIDKAIAHADAIALQIRMRKAHSRAAGIAKAGVVTLKILDGFKKVKK
jgi:hypothetical protein